MSGRNVGNVFQSAKVVQVEGRVGEYHEAVVVEHRQQPTGLVGRQTIMFQCVALAQL